MQSIQRYTRGEHELWVVDNNSPSPNTQWLCAQPGINIVFNQTAPIRERNHWRRFFGYKGGGMGDGSYANAVALELASQVIDPTSHFLFVAHNDVLATREGWLEFLVGKLNDRVRGAAVSHDPIRVGAMHQSGFIFDFTLFRPLRMSFLPNLPEYDVGDAITLRLRKAGYECHVCRNTFNCPESIAQIAEIDPLRAMYCDRVFDDDGRVMFLHLGRGTVKAAGEYHQAGKTYPEQWIRYADEHLLS